VRPAITGEELGMSDVNERRDKSQRRFKPGKPPKVVKTKRTLESEVANLRADVARLVAQDLPILAGPFTGEVGFELLYWVPLIRWVMREFPELAGRLTVISRGGTQDWLNGLDVGYVDILSLFSTEDFLRHRENSEKQRQLAGFESEVVEAVRRLLGFDEVAVLHPSLLYESYFRFLKINQLAYPRAVTQVDGRADGLAAVYQPMDAPDLGILSRVLPDDYVAVRFYSSESFPDTPECRRFASAVIEALSSRTNVVMMRHRFTLDEHRDVQAELPPGVMSCDNLMRPDNNLALQTAIVGRATAFIGTYGGFAYLAPLLGVRSLSFSMDRGKTHSWHLDLAQKIFDGPSWGPLVSLRPSDLSIVNFVARDFDFDAFGDGLPGAT
jgi:hypothetical protein